ncbi:MAG: hypothetical protein AB7U73_10235 [Pirellulales bacterium]
MIGRLLIVLLIAEVCLRGHSWWSGEQRFYRMDAHLGWRINGGLHRIFGLGEGAFLVETNSRGYRDREHNFQKPADKFRVVVLGASTIFGDGIHQDLLCTEVLERLLPDIEVINLACVGYSPAQHDVMLSRDGFRFYPDMVVEFLITTDEKCTFESWDPLLQRPKCCLVSQEDRITIRPPRFPIWQGLLSNSYLAEHLSLVALPVVAVIPGLLEPQPSLSEEQKLAALRQLVLHTWNQCQKRGIEYRAVYLPSGAELEESSTELPRFIADRLLGRMAAEDALPLVDITEPLRAAQAADHDRKVFGFLGLHLNARGHEVVAQELARLIAPLAVARRQVGTAGALAQ